jgi:D-xylose transport system substrate-binding protein
LQLAASNDLGIRWKRFVLPAAVALLLTTSLIGRAGASRLERTTNVDVCVLLPDTKSSVRYELFDRPYLAKAFRAAGVSHSIVNARGSPQTMRLQADACLAKGAKVVLLDALDLASGVGITNAVVAGGATVIDYDRLVPHSKAAYYVSFNNVRVGTLMGRGLVSALKANGGYSRHPTVAILNGSITDNNARLVKRGYGSVLNPLFRNGTFEKATAGDQWTDWNPIKGSTIFEQMLARNSNMIDAVIAANDGIAGAVIAVLKNHGLKPIPVTGQDATPTGVQHILAGWQSGTVYKAVKAEAAAAARVVISLLRHRPVKTNGSVSGTKSVILTPIWITKANYKLLFKDGFLKKSQVCVGVYARYCK